MALLHSNTEMKKPFFVVLFFNKDIQLGNMQFTWKLSGLHAVHIPLNLKREMNKQKLQ